MAGPKFEWFASHFGNSDVVSRVKYQIAPSITVLKGQPLTFGANGKLALSTVAQVVDAIAGEDATSTATSITKISIKNRIGLWKSILACITGATTDPFCTAAGSTTTAKFLTAGGTTGDMIGGIVYFPLTGEIRVITANTYSSTEATVTWVEPIAVATATTSVIRVSILGPGDKTAQLAATGGAVGGALVADKTSGKVAVYEVDIVSRSLYSTFNPT